MKKFFICDAQTGHALQRVTVPDDYAPENLPTETGQAVVEFSGSDEEFSGRVTAMDGGQIVFVPAQPDTATELARAKIEKMDAIRQMKARREQYGCATPLGMMDSDEGSRNKLLGAIVEAQISAGQGQPFSISWTMADNVNVPHNAAQIIAAGRAVGQFINACHVKARALKQAVEQAADMAELEAINIETGWPGGN